MIIKSYTIDAHPNEYNIVKFSQPDELFINPNQILYIEKYHCNGVETFDIVLDKTKKSKGVMYRIHLTGTPRPLYVDEDDKKKIEVRLK